MNTNALAAHIANTTLPRRHESHLVLYVACGLAAALAVWVLS